MVLPRVLLRAVGLLGLATGCASAPLFPGTSPAPSLIERAGEPGHLLDVSGVVPLWGEWVCDGAAEGARAALVDARDRCEGGDLRGGLEVLDGAASEYPGEAGLFEARGAVLARMGFSRAAEKEFQCAAGLHPSNPGAWWALGFVRFDLGLPRAAGEALRSAYALGERDPELLVLLARVERLEGDLDKAAEHYALALARDPSADADRLLEAASLFLEDELSDPSPRYVALALGWLDRAEDVHPGDERLPQIRTMLVARHGP